MLACVGFVLAAQNSKGKTKGDMMFYHKSCGTLAMGLLFPRIAVRLVSKIPPPVTAVTWEIMAAKAGHAAMYAFAIVLPSTGVAMGYFGGKGLPFFYTTLPGASDENKNGEIAKNAFKVHKLAGQALEYMIVLHIGGALLHVARGQPIFRRMIPGVKSV